MRNMEFAINKNMSMQESMDFAFIVANSRLACSSYVKRQIANLEACVKFGNKSVAKQIIKTIKMITDSATVERLCDSVLKSGRYQLLSKILSTKAVLGYSFEESLELMKSLAKEGYLKAIPICVLYDRENLDAQIIKKIKEIDLKPIKTPEEWEIVASYHYDDKIFSSSRSGDKIKIEHINDLFNLYYHDVAFVKQLKYFLGRNDDLYQRMKTVKSCVFDEIEKKYYSFALRNAQEGYYKRCFDENRLEDIYSFLFVSEGNARCLVQPEKLQKHSFGMFHDKRYFQRTLEQSYRCRTGIHKADLLPYFLYNHYLFLSTDDQSEKRNCVARLCNVARIGLKRSMDASKETDRKPLFARRKGDSSIIKVN